MRVVKMAAIARTVQTEKRSSSATKHVSLFLTRSMTGEVSSHITDRMTHTTTTVTLTAHARRGLMKGQTLDANIWRGAKELLRVREALRKRMSSRTCNGKYTEDYESKSPVRLKD